MRKMNSRAMISSKDFRKFTLGFRQGTLEPGISVEQWIQDALGFINIDELRSVKVYLSELLARNPGGQELQQVWNGSSASYYIADDEELRSFLRLVLEQIEFKDSSAPSGA